MLRDLRYALRMLVRSRIFAVAAMTVVALGIGASTAIFSVIDRVLMEPLPYPEPDRLVQLVGESPMGISQMASIPKFNLLRERAEVFPFVAAYDSPVSVRLGDDEGNEVQAQRVSADYFPVFGLKAEHGSIFKQDDDRPHATRVAVLSHRLWVRRFRGDAGLIGRDLSVDGETYRVMGVVEQGDRASADLFLPLQADPHSSDHASHVRVVVRLAAAVSLEGAQMWMNHLNVTFYERFGAAMAPGEHLTVMPLRDLLVGDIGKALWMLSCAVGVLLLSACANAASLQLAHATRRAREIATRAALGASRRRLVAQLMTESVLVSAGGGVLGVALGRLAVGGLLSLYPGAIPLMSKPIGLDWRVVLFSLLVTIGTGVLCGLPPALSASRVDLSESFKEGHAQAGSGGMQMRLRSLLVMGQFALAMVLLVGAGLAIRLYGTMNRGDRSFDATNILTVEMPLTGMESTASVDQLIRNVELHVRTIPGVVELAETGSLPMESGETQPFIISGLQLTSGFHGLAQWRSVSKRYFDVFHIRLTRGRGFTDLDTFDALPVVIINETLARKYWPGGYPVGKRLILGMYAGMHRGADKPREIVGVVADVRETGLARIPEPAVYVPAAQVPDALTSLNNHRAPITWAIRTKGDPVPLSGAIQRELRSASGGFPFGRIRTMDQVLADASARMRFNVLLLTIFSGAALMLAAVGLYGLMAYSVDQRAQEIGIRMAIGASPEDVRDMFMRQALRLAFTGIAAGTFVAWAVSRILIATIWGVDTSNPEIFGYLAILLCGITLLAAYLPARRAVRVDPAVVLRRL